MRQNRRTEQGFSLIEIMIALVISLILMAGVLTIMSSSKRTYLLQDELGQLQENARFALDDIAFNVRMAGFYGCSASRPVGLTAAAPLRGWDNESIITAFRGADGTYLVNPTVKTANAGKNEPASDILQVATLGRSTNLCDGAANASAATNISNLNNSTGSELLLPNADYPLGSSLILADCGGGRVYRVASRSGNKVQIEGSFGRTYGCPVDLFSGEESVIRYEIRAVDKDDNDSARDRVDGFALFRTDPNNPPNMRLLVDGVQNLQIRLGVDTDNSGVANRYVPIGQNVVGRVVSVRITLLMRTPNFQGSLPEVTNPESYIFTLDPDIVYRPMRDNLANEQGYRHRVFTTTIQVRN
jgi:type IV pilus assembly protein PilW